MVHYKKKLLGFGVAAAGFFIIALLIVGAAMGGDGGLADDRIVDLSESGIEGGSEEALVASSVTTSINYQGRLTDSSGNPLNGTYTMSFKLYETATGGTALVTDTHSVTVTDGLFSTTINLGRSSFDGRALWLGIQVESDPEMTPRQELRPVPYALGLVPEARIEGDSVDPVITVINHGLGTGIQAQGAAIGLEATGMTGIEGEGDVGVRGTGSLGSGIVGTVTGVSNVNPGVLGENPNYSGVGVEGQAGFGTGVKGQGEIGVYGQSSVGPGVYGRGGPFGVHGYSVDGAGVYGTSDTGYGMYGTTTSTTGHGVHGEVAGSAAIGVYGKSSGANGQGVTGHGTGTSGTGVYGNGTSIGVQGWSELGTGVLGSSATTGVWGVSTAGSGLRGQGGQYGVYGNSENGIGVFGIATSLGSMAPGVYGYHQGVGPGLEGYSQEGVGVYGVGSEAGGYFTTTGASGLNPKPGVNVSTQYNYNPGVFIKTSGDYSNGVSAATSGYISDGVSALTNGDYSYGVYARTYGNSSYGVFAYSSEYYAIYANTDRTDHNYSFYTYDNIYVGGKISAGTVDPIIIEGFKADDKVTYEIGDVVFLDESGVVKPCSKADDTRVVGVVGPTLEFEDGELMVVIMGHQGAKPDEEHLQVLEERLERAEAQQLTNTGKLEEPERLDSEIAMLRSQLDEAKSVIRQVVRVKADASYGTIKAGDLLTSSPTEGHAMKAQPVELGGVEIYRPGTIIGKAMEPLNSGTGLIEVFVTLQ